MLLWDGEVKEHFFKNLGDKLILFVWRSRFQLWTCLICTWDILVFFQKKTLDTWIWSSKVRTMLETSIWALIACIHLFKAVFRRQTCSWRAPTGRYLDKLNFQTNLVVRESLVLHKSCLRDILKFVSNRGEQTTGGEAKSKSWKRDPGQSP